MCRNLFVTCVRQTRKRVGKVVSLLRTYQNSREVTLLDRAIAIVEDEIMVGQGYPAIERRQLEAQVPGGMISNLHNQLKDQGKLDLMPQILEKVPRVRAAAGFVPLVTPTSQIVGSQAAFNVMTGSPYTMMTKEFKALVAGRYGKLPAEPAAAVLQRVKDAGETICTNRPADYVAETDLAAVYNCNPLIRSNREALLPILFAMPVKTFFEKRAAMRVIVA